MNQTTNSSPSKFPPLIDNFGRRISYLRLAVTDRCNLRCRYCMPERGIEWIPRRDILTFEEMLRLVRLMVEMGITKVRLTGGEPFLRNGLPDFLGRLREIPGLQSLHITTNGVFTAPHIGFLESLPISGINLSVDTLQEERFQRIARREGFNAVMKTLYGLLESSIPLKINTVVLDGFNDDELVPIALLARDYPVEVRFIEQMPFDGEGDFVRSRWNWKTIQEHLQKAFPGMTPLSGGDGTTRRFQIPGFTGTIGVIGGHSRIFCDTCSRIRITPAGQLKTCLYDRGVLDLKALLRNDASDDMIQQAIQQAVSKRAANGFEVEQRLLSIRHHSMATIGG